MLAAQYTIFFIGITNSEERIKYKKELENLCESVDIIISPSGSSKWRQLFTIILNLFSPLPFTVHKNYFKNVRTKIKKLIENNKIDLVHVDILPLALYYKDFKSLPKILVDHNVEFLRLFRWMTVESNIFLKVFLYYQFLKLRSFEKKICPKFERCVVVSEEDRHILETMCKSTNFITLPNGVDVHYYRPTNNIKIINNSLIWVGGMRYAYSADAVDYFLDKILPLIRFKIPNIITTFIGDNPTSKLIKNAKENPNIKVLGYVDDVRSYIERAALFIAPIRCGSGTKIKVLNAMALEKAVVTTSIGVEGIKAIPNEDIMIADTPRDFAQKSIYLLEHPQEAERVGKKGRKIIEKYYAWEMIGQKMYPVYEEVGHSKLAAE